MTGPPAAHRGTAEFGRTGQTGSIIYLDHSRSAIDPVTLLPLIPGPAGQPMMVKADRTGSHRAYPLIEYSQATATTIFRPCIGRFRRQNMTAKSREGVAPVGCFAHRAGPLPTIGADHDHASHNLPGRYRTHRQVGAISSRPPDPEPQPRSTASSVPSPNRPWSNSKKARASPSTASSGRPLGQRSAVSAQSLPTLSEGIPRLRGRKASDRLAPGTR